MDSYPSSQSPSLQNQSQQSMHQTHMNDNSEIPQSSEPQNVSPLISHSPASDFSKQANPSTDLSPNVSPPDLQPFGINPLPSHPSANVNFSNGLNSPSIIENKDLPAISPAVSQSPLSDFRDDGIAGTASTSVGVFVNGSITSESVNNGTSGGHGETNGVGTCATGSGQSSAVQTGEAKPNGEGRKITCEDIQLVQNLIERCLQLYMHQHEVISTLQYQAKIEPGFTGLVWQKLEEQNPEFFKAYYTRLKIKDQITQFNQLLEQHAQLLQKLRISPQLQKPTITSTPMPPLIPLNVHGAPMGYPMLPPRAHPPTHPHYPHTNSPGQVQAYPPGHPSPMHMTHGTPMPAHGSPLVAHGSPMMTHGAPIMTHGSPMAQGMPAMTHGRPMHPHMVSSYPPPIMHATPSLAVRGSRRDMEAPAMGIPSQGPNPLPPPLPPQSPLSSSPHMPTLRLQDSIHSSPAGASPSENAPKPANPGPQTMPLGSVDSANDIGLCLNGANPSPAPSTSSVAPSTGFPFVGNELAGLGLGLGMPGPMAMLDPSSYNHTSASSDSDGSGMVGSHARDGLGILGQIPRNFSLSDLAADFAPAHHTDGLMGTMSGSPPFLTTEAEQYLQSPEKEEDAKITDVDFSSIK